jgi:glucarate dehydratase
LHTGRVLWVYWNSEKTQGEKSMNSALPVITEMKVIPVAGYDSMLLSLSGAHAPFFTRNLVILEDSAGRRGVGEVHGGNTITRALEGYVPLMLEI